MISFFTKFFTVDVVKKFISLFMAAVLCLGLVACGGNKIETVQATDSEKQTVINAAVKFFESDAFVNGAALHAELSGEAAEAPELLSAYTLKHDDVEGYSVDLVLCNVKAWITVEHNGEYVAFDKVQFIVDNKTGTVYDSVSCEDAKNNFNGTISSEEDVMVMFLNSGVLLEGGDDRLWSENETSTRFKGSDLKEINKAVLEAIG